MVRAATFGKGVLDFVLAQAAATPAVEVCGLLLGAPDCVDAAVACANIAAEPATRFEIDPVALFAALRAERAGGPRVIGCYHSHPGGIAFPSPRDAAQAAANDWLWLIVGEGRAALFRAVADGAILGRFQTLPLSGAPA